MTVITAMTWCKPNQMLAINLPGGEYRVGVRVSDGDGGVKTTSVLITVTNVNPSVNLVAPNFAQEGERISMSCIGADQGSDFLAIDWDLDGDGSYERPNTTQQLDYTFFDEGTYVVRCRVRDGAGGSASAQQDRISNLKPIVEVDFGGPFQEGSEALIRVQASDPGNDELTYRFDFDGDNVPDGPPSASNLADIPSLTKAPTRSLYG